jgi:hypothetical protein
MKLDTELCKKFFLNSNIGSEFVEKFKFCVTSSHLNQKVLLLQKLSYYEMTDSVLNNNNNNFLYNNNILKFNNVLLFKIYYLEFMLN